MAEQGTVEVDGQLVTYELLEVDVRDAPRREADAASGRLSGAPAVVIPGHGQTPISSRKLTEAAAALSPAGVAWCIDIFMRAGGDPVKAEALGSIVRDRISGLFPASDEPDIPGAPAPQAILLGWSHGGGEALRSARCDPDLFPRVAGLCPAGLIERHPLELLLAFVLEVTRIVWRALALRDSDGLRDALRVGRDILRGIWRDVSYNRSGRAALDDIRWASRKVPGPGFGYGGDVALVFARDDTVIRWQAVFPGCSDPEEIPVHLDGYRRADFPRAAHFRVTVLDGNHLSPESAAAEYARTAYALLGVEPADAGLDLVPRRTGS